MRRFFTQSLSRQVGPIQFDLNRWALPLPHVFGGWEVKRVWFGVGLGGTPADDVISLGCAFDLPDRVADAAWRLADRATQKELKITVGTEEVGN